MLEWYKSNKIFFYFILLFVIVFPVSAVLDNCKGTVDIDDVPCYILLPFNTSGLTCSDYSVVVYNTNESLYEQTMDNYNYFNCNATFNQTTAGTYTIQFSTGDTADIIVQEGYTRFYIYISLFILLFGFLLMGYYMNQPIFHYFVGFLAPIMAFDIFNNGFPQITNTFMTNSITIILIGIGFYYLILPSLNFIMEWNS